MAKTITEMNDQGVILTSKAPKRAKAGEFPKVDVSTRRKRIARNLWG